MLKLMKYEFRKTRTTLLVMMAALVVLEAGFLIGDRMDNYKIAGISLGLLTALVFAVYIYILIAGIVSYSRELNDRSGYLTFMAPVSPAGVVASKLLFTMLAALGVTALFGAAAYFDYRLLFRRLGADADTFHQFDFAFRMFASEAGMSLTQVLMNVAFEAFTVVLSIMLLMCTAYLSITISATLLENKRGFVRGLVSFLFFGALQFATSRLSGLAIGETAVDTLETMKRMMGIQAAMDGAFIALFAAASALLLDRRVSL